MGNVNLVAEGDVLLVVPCTYTIDWSIEHKMYFDRVETPHVTPFRYLGMYKDMSIVAMGRVENCITCNYGSGELEIIDSLFPVTVRQKEMLRNALPDPAYDSGNYGSNGHKFYLLDEDNFAEMNFRKVSTSGIQKFLYMDLSNFVAAAVLESGRVKEIAKALSKVTWINKNTRGGSGT